MKILIAGGSGLIGNALKTTFIEKGYEVGILSRKKKKQTGYYFWDPSNKLIDKEALKDTDVLINLAGATISEGRWTGKKKRILKESRVLTTKFLVDQAKQYCEQLKLYIGSSAVGIYKDGGNQFLTEQATIDNDFMSDLAVGWEAAHREIETMTGVRSSILRIGVVLSQEGGAYPVFKKNMILGISPNFGSKLYYPLVHIKDVVRVFQWLIDTTQARGIYNLSCPTPTHHLEVFKWIGKYGKKGFIPVPAPKLILRLAMGEQSEIVLRSLRVIPERLLKEGFIFNYGKAESIIKDLENTNP